MNMFNNILPVPSSTKDARYRARPHNSKMFLHAGGDSLTANEDFAWFGSIAQFKALKASKGKNGIWAPEQKWSLVKRRGFQPLAPQNTPRAI